MQFSKWLNEQPHVSADQPVDFKINGIEYRNVSFIDPRFERWADSNLSTKFSLLFMGIDPETKERIGPQKIYFTDDIGRNFELDSSGMRASRSVIPELLMPQYWIDNAQILTTDGQAIDNMQMAA